MALKTIQSLPVPESKDAEFDRNRLAILEEFYAKIPKDLILPAHIIDGAPRDVTGIPRSCGLLTETELKITEDYDAVALASEIAKGALTSVQVVTAFARRAAIAHQLTCCLTDFFLEEALERARELDEVFARTGKTIGPLHGVPISVKEMIPVKGHICSVGLMVTRHIAANDCLLVELLRSMGAVFYVKTHQPTGVMSFECTSFLGRTLNPYNTALTPGGSSGGEGALIAMKGSVFGLGTDIGGSIRVPAACCGIFGLKGSSGFWPTAGLLAQPFPAGLNLDGVIGPMARSLRDIDFVTGHLKALKPYLSDPDVLPILWKGLNTSAKSLAELRIGIMMTDAQPPVQRAMEWALSRLQSAGCTIKPRLTFHQALAAANEPRFDQLEAWIQQCVAADAAASNGKGVDEVRTALDIASRRFQRDQFRLDFARYWQEQGDPDIVICPVSAGPACKHETSRKFDWSWLWLWNLADYPALVIPTPVNVEKGEECRLGSSVQDDFVGAPIGLQIAARRHCESELIAAMGLVKDVLGIV